MAKWGEGDPRWIVEDRPDATNVNNWHWSEKNATKWSEDRLRDLLSAVDLNRDLERVKITEVEKLKGEAIVNNRKAKLIYLYDWTITGKWQGYLKQDKTKKYDGFFEIQGLSDENDIDEVDIEITTKDTTNEGYKFKDLMRKEGTKVIQKQLGTYVKELKTDFAKGLIKPKAGSEEAPEKAVPVAKPAPTSSGPAPPPPAASVAKKVPQTEAGVKIKCMTVSLQDTFKCDARQLYDFFTQRHMIQGWSKCRVEWEMSKGSKFQFFDGAIEGVLTDFVPSSLIKMNWRFKTWPSGHFSDVKISITQGVDNTTLILEQTGVPEGDYERTREGWLYKTFQAIKATFGVGEYSLN